jgi:hypothetical protein
VGVVEGRLLDGVPVNVRDIRRVRFLGTLLTLIGLLLIDSWRTAMGGLLLMAGTHIWFEAQAQEERTRRVELEALRQRMKAAGIRRRGGKCLM